MEKKGVKISLDEINLATNNFSDENYIGKGGFGDVYKGKLAKSGQEIAVAVKRLDRTRGQGHREFKMEIQMLSCCRHANIISLVGYCEEKEERILVYELATHGSLDKHLSNAKLSWMQRLKISLGAARGFSYLHNDVGTEYRILHRDIKSANILLNENWEAKISDFGLSKAALSEVEFSTLVTDACGTKGYIDPQYMETGTLTNESDVYSFGVMLLEILCGRSVLVATYHDKRRFLVSLAKKSWEQGTLHDIILLSIKNEIKKRSLDVFSDVAYQCLNENRSERPTMSSIVQKLEQAMQYQESFMSNTNTMEKVQRLKIPLEEIKSATDNFSDRNFIAKDRLGNLYGGKLTISGLQYTIAVKRLDRKRGQGDREFLMEIQMLSSYRHKNLACLLGFCEESGESILVYEHAKYGSLDRYLSNILLSWVQRLKISLGAARGFNYLHNDVGSGHRVLHRDIKSSNILLDKNMEAKITDFGLSKIGLSNVEYTFLVTNACGTLGYIDPEYYKTGILTKESDVFSFGVVLFEMLCGRIGLIDTYQDERRFLASLAQRSCEQNTLYEIILPDIKDEINTDSLNVYSMVAYQCLKEKRIERPTMAWIEKKLEKALDLQVNGKVEGFIHLGTWGKQIGGQENNWSFKLEQGHKLQKITIDHGDDVIYSLVFTSESRGVMHPSNKAGGSTGHTISEVTLDFDEEIVGITGSIGTRGGDTIISSLSFKTNKTTHGPFGEASNSSFSIPLDKASIVGFYGTGSNYINSIGVYAIAHDEIMRVGTWGTSSPGGPQNRWSFELEKNHHLSKITIDHGDLIYSLVFTSQYGGLTNTSKMAGGWNGGDKVSEVTFDWNEEITAINGTVGTYGGYTIISSISFVTNQKTHGPFGNVSGTPFTIPWDNGSLTGFYGLCGYYIDSIGVSLKVAK